MIFNDKFFARILLAATIIYFLVANLPAIHKDLWNDEIYTLKKFTLVPITQTLTDYHAPNNHIFYNLCDNIYLKCLGIHQLQPLFEQPWILRLPLLLLSVLVFYYTYKLGQFSGNRIAGLLAALLLATYIPYQNFCMQVRGYPFSILFDVALAYYVLQYLTSAKIKHAVLIAILTFATIYTIPSNLYCIAAMLLFLSLEALTEKIKYGSFGKKNIYAAIAVCIGIALALLAYLPVINHVFSNEYVQSVAPMDKKVVSSNLPYVYHLIVSGRIFLFAIFIIGIAAYLLTLIWKTSARNSTLLKLLLFVMITPFVMAFIRGERPPDRIFVYLAPFLCLLIALFVAFLIELLPNKFWFRCTAVALLAVYIITAHQIEVKGVERTMKWNLDNDNRTQSLYYNYYQHNYTPSAVAHFLKSKQAEGTPVILQSSEPHDMPDYLVAYNIPYHSSDSLEYFLTKDKSACVLTLHTDSVYAEFNSRPQFKVQEVFTPNYHHVLKITAVQ